MARQKLKAVVSIMVDGKLLPMFTKEEGCEPVFAMPEEERIKYSKLMLKNIERAETEYYANKNAI